MKASELRVGNFIRFNNLIQPEEIVTINPRFFCSAMCNKDFDINGYYKPIPLTEEWLLKFGWGKDDYYGNIFKDNVSINDIVLEYDIDCNILNIETNKDVVELSHIENVHQLQNLYFSLTGEELSL